MASSAEVCSELGSCKMAMLCGQAAKLCGHHLRLCSNFVTFLNQSANKLTSPTSPHLTLLRHFSSTLLTRYWCGMFRTKLTPRTSCLKHFTEWCSGIYANWPCLRVRPAHGTCLKALSDVLSTASASSFLSCRNWEKWETHCSRLCFSLRFSIAAWSRLASIRVYITHGP